MHPAPRYSPVSIALHWLMLLLIAATYATMEFRGLFPRGSDARELIKQWHFMLGMSIFFLVWLRLLARLVGPKRVGQALPGWQQALAHLAHLALYGLMIGLPLLGWLSFSAAGKQVPFFGLQLPSLIAPDKALSDELREIHETVAVLGYWLIGVHAAAALFHHYLRRDDVLTRMLPGTRKAL